MPPKTQQRKPKSYTFRLDEALMNQIKSMAEDEMRPIGSQVELLLREALSARQRQEG